MTARAWPAKCASCGQPVRKAESHSGAPRSGIAVRHLACAERERGAQQGTATRCSCCSQEQHDTDKENA